jgi:allantoin racemase
MRGRKGSMGGIRVQETKEVKAMKIWNQLPLKGSEQGQPFYKLLEAQYNLVKRHETEVVIKDVPTGIRNVEWLDYSGFRFLNGGQLLKNVLVAEREGFDGVLIDCFGDPALGSARQLLKIPVVGLAESSLHLACHMGARFAVITDRTHWIPEVEELITAYGLESRTIKGNPVRAGNFPREEVMRGVTGDFGPVAESFKKIAAHCVEDGAEVLIVGCALISPVLFRAGLTEVDGAAVIHPHLISLKLLEALVDLHKAGIPVVSRKSSYLSASGEEIGELLASLA